MSLFDKLADAFVQLRAELSESAHPDPKDPKVGDVFTTITAKGFKAGDNWPKHNGIHITASSIDELREISKSKGLRIQESSMETVSYGYQLKRSSNESLLSDTLVNADGFYAGYRRNSGSTSYATCVAGPFATHDEAKRSINELPNGYTKSRADMVWHVRNGREV